MGFHEWSGFYIVKKKIWNWEIWELKSQIKSILPSKESNTELEKNDMILKIKKKKKENMEKV